MQTESLEPKPVDAYGRSKLAAEQGLAALDIDWVALRPVLVYGPGVKGNMAELIRLARSRLPLPFGGLTARRSLLSLDNLVGAVDCVLSAPAPLRRPLVVADPEPVTLPEMVAAIRRGLGRRPGLIPVPSAMLAAACRVAGPRGSLSPAGGLAGGRSGGAAAARLGAVRHHTGRFGGADAIIARSGTAQAQSAPKSRNSCRNRSRETQLRHHCL